MAASVGPSSAMTRTVGWKVTPGHRTPRTRTATEDRSVIAIPPVPVTNSATAQGHVAAGLGVSLLPRSALARHHPGVVVRKVRGPEPVRAVHTAVREASLRQPPVRGLLDALRDVARRTAAPARS